jgi:hypothetical protein
MAAADAAANAVCMRLGGTSWFTIRVRPEARARAALRVEEGEYHENAAVIGGADGQVELVEDARDVLLHRPFGDHQTFRDPLVRAALGHQLEHLALARAHAFEQAAVTAAIGSCEMMVGIDCRTA